MIKYVIFVLIFIVSLSSNTVFGNSSQSQLTEVQKQLKINKAKSKSKIKEKKRAVTYMNRLNKEIRYNELKLRQSQKKLTAAVKLANKANKEVLQSEKQYLAKQKAFEKRLLEIYKHPPLTVIETILEQDLLLNSDQTRFFINRILKQDIELMETLQKEKLALTKQKQKVVQQKNDIATLKRKIKSKEAILNRKKNAQKHYINNLSSQISTLLRQNKELESLSKELTNLIFKAQGESGYYGTGTFMKPVKGWISSRYGMRMHPIFKRKIKHTGIDIAAPKGYRIRAADSGKVIFSGVKGGYGKSVLIYHGKRPSDKKSISSFYAHASRLVVKTGDMVKKGDEIGFVGSTGYATGPHLHFEMKLNGVHVDPMKFLNL
ncbi:hypothetical protein DID76_04320 [Candidatus Marinamargulisbacteria bacterium SCGC AG-414-C22]|nr:hypothetical protein DID76_04320 [Candidatus Marinamargulisbacteria bacterium SCGC AG-414-C22]